MSSSLEPNTFTHLPKFKTFLMFGDDIIVHYGVPGDGTCFFYSLCAILNMNNYMSQSLNNQIAIGRQFRCSLTNDLSWDEWTHFLKLKNIRKHTGVRNLAQLKQKMCSYSVWADEPVIRFIMYKLRLNLIFLDEKLNKLYCGVSEPEAELTAVIYWVDKSHFEPLGRLNALNLDTDQAGIQFQFYAEHDAEFINRLMDRYDTECSV